jgi:predicted  nucleic acid-binding Zn-ribbon protein
VNEQLRLLINLQKIDSEILSTSLKIDAIPKKISSFENPLKKLHKAYEDIIQSHSLLEKKKKDKEQEIKEIKEKKDKLLQRSSEIKSNKEYQAHLKEIEKTDILLRSAEDELLEIMEALEKSYEKIEKEKKQISEERLKIEELKKELEKEAQSHEDEIKRLKVERKKIVNQLESKVYEEYMNLLRVCKGLAVVEAKNEICQGCNMHIPPQLFVEIKSGKDIIECPQCKRILYYVKADNG